MPFDTNDRGQFGEMARRLAKCFADAHRRYLHYSEVDQATLGDLGWFYNERANIGFLAAAAWMQPGWVALEEYGQDKRWGAEKRVGRADLYIGAQLNGHFPDVEIETKAVWPRTVAAMKIAMNPDSDKSELGLACADARRLPLPQNAKFRCGGLFVMPELIATNAKAAENRCDKLFDCFWQTCRAITKAKWAAFSFVSPNLMQAWASKKGPNLLYPAVGVVFVIV